MPEGANANAWLSNGSRVIPITGVAYTSLMLQLDSGKYDVGVAAITTSDPIVRVVYEGTVSTQSLSVCDGSVASLDVDYSIVPSSHRLWWGNTNGSGNTLAYYSEGLRLSAVVPAEVSAQTAGTLPGAFDRSGNVWLIDSTANAVGLKCYVDITAGTERPKTPDIAITSRELSGGSPGPTSIAFDSSGNLWVGVAYDQKVVEFRASHLPVPPRFNTALTATRDLTPDVEISNVPSPNALAFDAANNLWVGSGDNVIGYEATRLSASTAAPADISLSGLTAEPAPAPAALTNVLGLAFTSTQDLWVNWNGILALIESGALQSGALTPTVQITTGAQSEPQGMAFDETGGLWFAYSAGKFAKLGKTQLTASGLVTPEVIISSSDVGSATSPAFFPSAAGLPLFSSLP